jgi:hypothetical protein
MHKVQASLWVLHKAHPYYTSVPLEKIAVMKSGNYEIWRDTFALSIDYPTARPRRLEEILH